MVSNVRALGTVGQIADRSGFAVHQVEYFLRSRGITPASKAGNARVFSEEQVEQIIQELRRMAELRRGVTS